MKPITEIYDEADIDALIANKAEEGPYLEFKRADSYTNVNHTDGKISHKAKIEISCDVSAFANSEGGILIYGLAEVNHVADSKSYIDGNIFTKERLEQLIADKVQRKMDFTIDPIRSGGDITKSIYVVRIPASDNRPHMAGDGKFYKRGNFRKVEMQEYEVRDSYNRPTKTTLDILPPQIIGKKDFWRGDVVERYSATISFKIKNVGKVVEKMHALEIHVPKELVAASYIPNTVSRFFQKRIDTRGNYYVYCFPQTSELFPEQEITVASAEFIINKDNFAAAEANAILAKLYYSSETKESQLFMIPGLLHDGHLLDANCFKDNRDR